MTSFRRGSTKNYEIEDFLFFGSSRFKVQGSRFKVQGSKFKVNAWMKSPYGFEVRTF
jgi:hypothetical protein